MEHTGYTHGHSSLTRPATMRHDDAHRRDPSGHGTREHLYEPDIRNEHDHGGDKCTADDPEGETNAGAPGDGSMGL